MSEPMKEALRTTGNDTHNVVRAKGETLVAFRERKYPKKRTNTTDLLKSRMAVRKYGPCSCGKRFVTSGEFQRHFTMECENAPGKSDTNAAAKRKEAYRHSGR